VYSASLLGPATAVDAGVVVVGESGAATFDVTNAGNALLTVSGVTSDDAAFVATPSAFTLGVGQTETVTVTFAPSAEGAQAATITLTHDAPGSPTVVTATGTGTAPVASVSITSPTDAQVFPPGTTTASLTVDIVVHTDKWAWQLDTPFPASGAAGGVQLDATTLATTVTGLTDGATHTLYVTLVDGSGDVLATPVEDSVTLSVGSLPADYVQVASTQGGSGTTITVPITIYDVSLLTVTAVDIDRTYDETVLTPTSEGAGVTAAAIGSAIPSGWSIPQNVVGAGQLAISLAGDGGDPAAPITGAGELLTISFEVAASASAGTVTPIAVGAVQLNEGTPSATGVGGLFTVLNIVYGDVTGNGAIAAFDASWVLRYVSSDLVGEPDPFPIEVTAPTWAPLPLTSGEAFEVADVDDDGSITAVDASHILERRVGLRSAFDAEAGPAAPSVVHGPLAYRLYSASNPLRPGGRVTVTLDASGMADLSAGELRLEFDPTLLRFVDAGFAPSDEHGTPASALMSEAESAGRVAVAFASARPLDTGASLLERNYSAGPVRTGMKGLPTRAS
jgi:hypothetical protein